MDSTTANLGSLVLAVLTYRRNELLAAVLPELSEQVAQAVQAGWRAELLVVDNSPEGQARSVVEAAQLPVLMRYVNETTPGLSAARNRALHEAAGARLLAFIDDDEHPGERWLLNLVDTWRETGAQAVTGPVRSDPVKPVDDWIRATGLFDRVTAGTGDVRSGTATNNLLLDMDFIRCQKVQFDPRFGLTGGEDSKFGQDLRRAGGRVVWCDEAEVSEEVPADRLEHAWIEQRLTRFGESWVRARVIDMKPRPALVFRARTMAKGLARYGRGQVGLWRAVRAGDQRAAGRAAAERAGGLGLVRGAGGLNREEYGRPKN
ncbi:glycosyltransferase family 2 protein [Luteococcus sp. Sow4_B9]|uniref:glycosyltransferase family 2 protein n=1 Tax=Luteococcus sp. Sow4_B9 TaxID=3438792 RepID=UPI003F94391D